MPAQTDLFGYVLYVKATLPQLEDSLVAFQTLLAPLRIRPVAPARVAGFPSWLRIETFLKLLGGILGLAQGVPVVFDRPFYGVVEVLEDVEASFAAATCTAPGAPVLTPSMYGR